MCVHLFSEKEAFLTLYIYIYILLKKCIEFIILFYPSHYHVDLFYTVYQKKFSSFLSSVLNYFIFKMVFLPFFKWTSLVKVNPRAIPVQVIIVNKFNPKTYIVKEVEVRADIPIVPFLFNVINESFLIFQFF